MGIFRRRDRPLLPVVPNDVEHADYFAVAAELSAMRPWLDPKVLQWPPGEPWVWVWTNPILGLMVIKVEGHWYATAMGFDENQLPKPFGITPRPVCPVGTQPGDVARQVVGHDVIHNLSTYVSSPDMEVLPYGMAWASSELFEFAKDGLVGDPLD